MIDGWLAGCSSPMGVRLLSNVSGRKRLRKKTVIGGWSAVCSSPIGAEKLLEVSRRKMLRKETVIGGWSKKREKGKKMKKKKISDNFLATAEPPLAMEAKEADQEQILY